MKTNKFIRARDGANRPVRGLWLRNGSYYLQTTLPDTLTGVQKVMKVRLPNLPKNVTEAKLEAEKLKERVRRGEQVAGGKTPSLSKYSKHYLSTVGKAEKSLANERCFLGKWTAHLKDCRLDQVTTSMVLAYRVKLLKSVSNRTANLYVQSLKNMFKLAKLEGIVKVLPTDGIKQLRVVQKEKPLITETLLEEICTEALLNHPRTGVDLANLVFLLAYSGCRTGEALRMKWSQVDFDNSMLTIVGTKGEGETRKLNMSKHLTNHLLCMEQNARGEFLFPSMRSDKQTTSMKKILNTVRASIGAEYFHLHLIRHYFISTCVMRGIDFLTIARWVGHKDGGVLIGKVYGHLTDDHSRQMTKLLN